MRIGMWAAAVLGAAMLSGLASGADLYVSPQGTAKGPGTKEAPYDLLTVLAGKGAQPGDTVWLMAGTYPAPEADVAVKGADGKPTGQMEKKRVAFPCSVTGTKEKPIILRAMPGQRVTLDGFMDVKGAYAWYWGFEVADLRYAASDHMDATLKKMGVETGINVFGPGTKFINLDVHDGAMGFGYWTPAVDAEIYGCVIHDFGFQGEGKDRGHGHAIYTQNKDGTKRIVDNVMFNGYGWNVHVYTQGGEVTGYHIEGNIAFCGGMKSTDGGNKDNYLLSAYKPLDRIAVIGNVGYDPRGGGRPNMRLSPYKGRNIAGEVKDNYLAGVGGLSIAAFEKMTVTGNTVWTPAGVVNFGVGKNDKGEADKWTADNNTYICQPDRKAFNGMTFAEYQKATGFDANSKLIASARPTTNYIFIRPNHYEPGRANVAVFNWEGKTAVNLDLSAVLQKGAAFEVHNVQDLYGKPIAAGVYDGNPVAVPMLKSKIAPDFDAFLVLTPAK